MTVEEIKGYIEKVISLETKIECMELTVTKLTIQLCSLSGPRKIEEYKYLTWKKKSQRQYFFEGIASDLEGVTGFPLVHPILTIAAVAAIWYFKIFVPVLVIGIPLVLIIIIIKNKISSREKYEKHNSWGEEVKRRNTELKNMYLKEVQSEKKRMAKINCQKQLLLRDIGILKSDIKACSETLDKLYKTKVIHPKYQIPLVMMKLYEYLDTGRCTSLGGHGGAYDVYEYEGRLDQIIDKLDHIIDHLKFIENEHKNFYRVISGINAKMDSIYDASMQNFKAVNAQSAQLKKLEENASLNAYNNKVIAENSEIMKDIIYYEKRMKGEIPANFMLAREKKIKK